MKKDNLINKIKNLLDLAEDENSQHEAEAAAKKAQALIMKYNIEEAELRQGDEATIEESLFHLWKIKNKSEGVWVRNLFHSVAKFNFCKIIIAKRWIDDEWKEVLYILGEKDNIELVKYLSTPVGLSLSVGSQKGMGTIRRRRKLSRISARVFQGGCSRRI